MSMHCRDTSLSSAKPYNISLNSYHNIFFICLHNFNTINDISNSETAPIIISTSSTRRKAH